MRSRLKPQGGPGAPGLPLRREPTNLKQLGVHGLDLQRHGACGACGREMRQPGGRAVRPVREAEFKGGRPETAGPGQQTGAWYGLSGDNAARSPAAGPAHATLLLLLGLLLLFFPAGVLVALAICTSRHCKLTPLRSGRRPASLASALLLYRAELASCRLRSLVPGTAVHINGTAATCGDQRAGCSPASAGGAATASPPPAAGRPSAPWRQRA